MLAKASSAALHGVDAFEVRVEVDIGNGLPHVLIVGLPGAAVQESRERVRTALHNSGLPYPLGRVVVNLAPADVRKEGPAFDLPIALALLAAQRGLPPDALADTLVVGELALDGSLRPVRGALSVGLFAAAAGFRRVLVPAGNGPEVALARGLEVLAPSNLSQAVAVLRGALKLPPALPAAAPGAAPGGDLCEVKGQASAKRALEVAAAGAHNVLLTGPPGSGKTMLASRLAGILPDLDHREAVDATRIHSAAGLPVGGLLLRPPFRQPHHSVSYAGLIGGGRVPRPGEVSLAHHGVLFLDELSEFGQAALEALRQPLEDGCVTISRIGGSVTLPARFLLAASRNPCPCGYAGDAGQPCICTPLARQRYRDRLSGPLLDRIDIRLSIQRLGPEELLRLPESEGSAGVRARVAAARRLALERQGAPNALLAGAALRRHAVLGAAPEAFARHAIKRLNLSGRGFDRMLRLARTVADLSGSSRVGEEHLAEAVAYREPSF